MDTFRLEKAAKLLRVNDKVKIVGALIPNNDNTERIQELKGIVTEPNDAIDEDFTSSNLNNIADLLAARVKRFVTCPGNTEFYFNACKLISVIQTAQDDTNYFMKSRRKSRTEPLI